MDQPPASPETRAQHLRIARWWLAIGGASITIIMTALSSWAGYLPATVAVVYAVTVSAISAGFYAMIRTGRNLRFADPSMTVAQLIAAGIAVSYLAYHGEEARPTFLIMYLLAYMFGAFTLEKRGLAAVALFYVSCYAATIGLALLNRPETVEPHREIFLLFVFGCVMAWMSYLGTYVTGLRRHLRRTTAELREALERANNLATHDSLTNCYNRRRMMEILDMEQKRARRGAVLSLCLVDLDHFKSINDRHGHQVGDEVLKQFVRLVQGQLRETDSLVRYGGEEFLVILPDTPNELALQVSERIRCAVEAETFPALPDGRHITVSAGIAEHRATEGVDRTLSRVDVALYDAKNKGRNCIVSAV